MTLTAKPHVATTDDARGIAQRVLFPENVDIDPGLTVAMNDDSLYGFIEPGESKPFPSGMTLTYSSDRPDVVSVSGSTIHTVANGAATITATATYNGKSITAKFVVRVLSYLDSIKYDGTPVPGFLPDVTNYDVTLPPGAPTPTVAATAPSATVAITQAAGVPGTATITATGPEGIVARYTVNFAQSASSDEFNDSSLDPKWTVVRSEREPRRRWRLADDHARGGPTHDEQRDDGEEPRARAGVRRLHGDDKGHVQPEAERRHAAGGAPRVPGRRQLPQVRHRGDVVVGAAVQHVDGGQRSERPGQQRAARSRSTRT